MFTELMASGSSGSSGAEWITDFIFSNNNKTASCSWDYDADTLIILYTFNNVKVVQLYDLSNRTTLWYANTYDKWQSYPVGSWIKATARTLTFTSPQNVALVNLSVIPIKGKPNGYFA